MAVSDRHLYSSLSDGLSELSILCDMEFSSDYFAFFEQPLRTLLCIGPPAILAYKRESSEDERLHAMMQTLREQSENEECEFCGKPLKPLPMPDMGVSGADKSSSAEQFCCTQYKNVCEFLFKEQKHIFNKDEIETISITPHAPFGSEVERKKAKEKTAQRLRERQMAKMFASVEKEPTTSYTEYGKPMKTLSYQLSNAPPVGDNWTIVPDSAAPDSVTNGYFGPKSAEWTSDVNTMDPELTCYDFTIHEEKMMPAQFTEKYYKNGKTFLMVFPDGTTQIFYPSGNLAINVIASKGKETICIVQEDKEHNADILAVLSSYGKATCYHPNGVVWININPVGGQYLDLTGRRIKRWKWKNDAFSNNSVLFKPIFISLNNQVGVRILSKEKILVTFLAMGKQAKFNIGSKSQTKQLEVISINPMWMQLSSDSDFSE
ncbi:glutamate-rich protein 6 [Bombina bombina]|uniref:glutamate-rich protein 6 n=1 Tax=Bombina bombina TaxID=8345 RepID=UPI00235ACE65|nr:glutamate-rich protein 6 [Bombina bombina]